jgi:hypothetical protein
MGHSVGDGIIVAALTAGVVGYFLLRFLERRRRLEILHAERVTAMDKGIPLPELPLDPPSSTPVFSPNPHVPLILGIVLTAFGAGSMMALWLVERLRPGWPMPLPVASIGVGLVLYHFLAAGGQSQQSAARRGH